MPTPSVLESLSRAAVIVSLVGSGLLLACSEDETKPAPPASAPDAGGGSATGDGGGGEGGGGGGNGCGGLCKTAGFTGGTETDFKNGLVECECSGTGGEVTKTACEGYCTAFGVSAADSLLSSEPGAKPAKCACDGT